MDDQSPSPSPTPLPGPHGAGAAPSARTGSRLPTHVVPRRYVLHLAPDIDAATFSGEVAIEVDIVEATESVTLHSLDLEIQRVSIRTGDPDRDGADQPATVDTDSEREWITLRVDEALPVGSATITLAFAGRMGDQLVGLYRSTFITDRTEHHLAVTQFESTHARRAFPCFDEPAFKAQFSITLDVPSAMLAVSNAAEVDRRRLAGADGSAIDRVTFAETVPMSTYLVALVVGPLEATGAATHAGRNGDIPLRVVHPPGKGHLCDFALEVAAAALEFFEDWYDLDYPGDKVDLVAVPDFAFGAMENLGCITFREVLVLVDPSTATPLELQRVADVINHELAHMWFGDLVTMSWWNGIWLNEAFATFMETTASDEFRPEWDVWTTFGLARAAAFDTDALQSTRPIEYEVNDAAEAEGMFDILTYEKGCSVVRMLEQYLGAEVFREGIREYLRRHAWGNTDTTDLWDALEDVTGEPVRRIMDDWIFHGGHPLVTVRSVAAGVELDQERATYDPAAPPEDPIRFPVPVVVETTDADGAAQVQRVLLEDATTLELASPAARVQANVGGNGFYRCLLDAPLRTALAGIGSPLERFVLVDDTWFAAMAGHIDLADAIDTIAAVADGESHPAVWRRVAGVCSEWRRLVAPSDRDAVAERVRRIAGSPNRAEIHDTRGREAEVVGVRLVLAGTIGGDESAEALAREVFEQRSAATDPALTSAALEVVASSATAAEHTEIVRRWHDAPNPQDEQRHLMATVLTTDVDLLTPALGWTLTEVRAQDGPYVLRRALTNPDLGTQAWAFLRSNWADIADRFPSSAIPRMLEGIRTFTDEAVATEVTDFLRNEPAAASGTQVDQHVERMWATVAAAARVRS